MNSSGEHDILLEGVAPSLPIVDISLRGNGIGNGNGNGNGNATQRLFSGIAVAVAAGVTLASAGWVFGAVSQSAQDNVQQKEQIANIILRLESIENGRTAPTPLESRIRFENQQREIDELKAQLKRR